MYFLVLAKHRHSFTEGKVKNFIDFFLDLLDSGTFIARFKLSVFEKKFLYFYQKA
jgi:hypothetical protein